MSLWEMWGHRVEITFISIFLSYCFFCSRRISEVRSKKYVKMWFEYVNEIRITRLFFFVLANGVHFKFHVQFRQLGATSVPLELNRYNLIELVRPSFLSNLNVNIWDLSAQKITYTIMRLSNSLSENSLLYQAFAARRFQHLESANIPDWDESEK